MTSHSDVLDAKANAVFGGKVVRKDLVRRVKVGANVPVYVLEYLLGRYAASNDEAAIQVGLRVVDDTLSRNFVRPDEAERIRSLVKERGKFTVIDKVRVRLLDSEDKYWAELVNFGHKYVHVPAYYLSQYERLLEGGIWAQIDLEYRADEEATGRQRPFVITNIKPIQLATFRLEEYVEGRKAFTTDEWMDLLIRTIGFEPSQFSRRLKLLFLLRLVPMAEQNYNLVELGPRGTGKSFVYREVSPYSILVSGGRTTVANLFYNMASGKMGLVGLWDVVAFDEVAGIEFSDRTAVQILKDYMESGSFSRGREELVADASMVFLGNINVPLEVLVRSGHLFQPLPEALQDMALIDRFHCYLPGWEAPKMRAEFFADHFGFVVDYLAEALRDLRKQNFADVIDGRFSLGSHLNVRDARAVRKTVAGLVKLLHPHREVADDELVEYLTLALECRRRVKEQLKKLGSFEYYQTAFSYIDERTMQEHFVGVPEQTGSSLLSPDPLPAGSVYAASLATDDRVALRRIEVARLGGSGGLRITGQVDRAVKDSIITAFDYARARKREFGIEKELDSYDLHTQVIDLVAGCEGGGVGVAFFVALYAALKDQAVQPAMVVLGDLTIQGNVIAARSLNEPLQMAMDNGARRALIPVENKRSFLEVPGDIVERVDPIFYGDALTAALKAVGLI
jgi:ATP-dependent Lon protease